ncbi:hypothetical protein [Weissella soli]|uniref:hypothetical protein n=1 Tax=Weissella soli TaxID=155866 RepID=UPI0011BBB44A|nr:hypothetical protein [Weissella soli]QEA34773.1 hypothetical protein FGL88_02970 [Weissella soli]
MDITKKITLEYDDENKPYKFQTVLVGDGTTPVVMAMGTNNIIGYNDDGSPIFKDLDEDQLRSDQQEFMAAAIATQKQLTENNGLDPETVNTKEAK